MFIAARNKNCVEIDITRQLEVDGSEEETDGKIVALHGESLFHRDDQIENDGLIKDGTYADLGDEELDMRVKEAAQNGVSEEETKRLDQLLK